MEPKNDGFQKESPFPKIPFSGSILNFREGNIFVHPRRTSSHQRGAQVLDFCDDFLARVDFRKARGDELANNKENGYKKDQFKGHLIFQASIWRGYVSFQGGNLY